MKLFSICSPDYYFYDSDEDLKKKYSYDPFLFNSSKFFNKSFGALKKSFYIINHKKDSITGQFNLCVHKDEGYSPQKAPFGSFEFEDGLSPDLLFEFWEFIERWIKENKIKSLHIKSYPAVYQYENNALITNTLINFGFTIKNAELNQHIIVNEKALIEKVSNSEKRRMIKCAKNNFRFSLSDIDQIEKSYEIIKNCRKRKNYPVTMSYKELEAAFINFPDSYLLFTVSAEKKIVAVCVSILINKNILYNFYPAHDENYDQFSPVTMLVEGIYSYCYDHNIRILDLGISTDESVLNSGLYKFKKNLSAKASLKLSFYKEF